MLQKLASEFLVVIRAGWVLGGLKWYFDPFLTFWPPHLDLARKYRKFSTPSYMTKHNGHIHVKLDSYYQPCQNKMSADITQLWIFWIFESENGFCHFFEWCHNFSDFWRMEKYPFVARHNHTKFCPYPFWPCS